jgi:hypothetical protein
VGLGCGRFRCRRPLGADGCLHGSETASKDLTLPNPVGRWQFSCSWLWQLAACWVWSEIVIMSKIGWETRRPGHGWTYLRVGTWLVLGLAVSLSAMGGLAAAELTSLEHIPDGHGTATVTWTGASGLHPTIKSVAGTVGRYRLKATGTVPNYFQHQGLTTSPTGVTATLATIKGTLAGTSFTITISLSTGGSSEQTQSFATVTGTFHGLPVAGTIGAPTTPAALRSDLGTFSGTIGSQHVQGTIYKPKSAHGRNTAHAVFVVSG